MQGHINLIKSDSKYIYDVKGYMVSTKISISTTLFNTENNKKSPNQNIWMISKG